MSHYRVIQNFILTCADCPNCNYYSGGVHECMLTHERIMPHDKKEKVGDSCPLPFAGPIVSPSVQPRAMGKEIQND